MKRLLRWEAVAISADHVATEGTEKRSAQPRQRLGRRRSCAGFHRRWIHVAAITVLMMTITVNTFPGNFL